MAFELSITWGKRLGETIDCIALETELGRGPTSGSIDEAGVSRRHASVLKTTQGYFLADLGSINGTYLNDSLVCSKAPLKAGDLIRLGPCATLQFRNQSRPQAEEKKAETRIVFRAPSTAQELSVLPESLPSRPARRLKLWGWVGLGFALLAVATHLHSRRPPVIEPSRLTRQPLLDSFGVGKKVKWRAIDFEVDSPTRAAVVLRYSADQIDPAEVALHVNGTSLGFIPPTIRLEGGAPFFEIVLAPRFLKQNAENRLAFDNVENPPHHNEWMIWGLSVQVIPLPELSPPDLKAKSEENFRLSRDRERLSSVGSDNLFYAWKGYRESWISVQGISPVPEIAELAHEHFVQVGQRLDHNCQLGLLEAKRAYELHNLKQMNQIVEQLNHAFPSTEHLCREQIVAFLEQHREREG